MIIKIGERGDDPGGLVAYLGGPGTLDEHIDPHIVAASMTPKGPLDRDQAVADLRLNAQLWPDVKVPGGHVWHSTIAIGKDEGTLPDSVWESISRDYLKGMNFGDVNWISVNHGPSAKGNDHVHVVASLVTDQGRKASVWNERYRSQKLAVDLEDRYGLQPLPGRRQGIGAQASSQKDLARARDQGLPESRRSQIERTVRASASVVSTVSEFEQILKANGLDFHPYKTAAGDITGYSVSTPATTTKQGVTHRWAGGKLARDLSLPRLQEVWKSNTVQRPTHIRAVQELQDMQRSLPMADSVALEDASHQLAGALATASLVEEKEDPGELAAASKQAGAYAQTVRASVRPKPPALSVGMLMLQATDPTGPVGKAVLIKQLMAAYRALLDAQFAKRALVTSRERNPSMAGEAGPEEQLLEISATTVMTTGAVIAEHHARAKEAAALAAANDPNKDLWDYKKIRQFRKDAEKTEAAKTAALKPPEGVSMVTEDQLKRAEELGKELDLPSVRLLAESLTEREAELYLKDVESKVVRQVPGYTPNLDLVDAVTFEDRLVAKHGHKVPDLTEMAAVQAQGPAAALAAEFAKADEKASKGQVAWLIKHGGMSPEEAAKMTSEGADSMRYSIEKQRAMGVTLTPAVTTQMRVPRQGHGRT